MTCHASSRLSAGLCRSRPGPGSRKQLCSMPCAPIRRHEAEFFASCSHRASARRARTIPSRSRPSAAFFISRRDSSPRAPGVRKGRIANFREAAMAEATASAKGTRPEGAVTEAEASTKVREMFTQIAPRYDLLNHLLSLQLDRLWRARVARRLRSILDRPEALVLDLCCGTGDLALALARTGKSRVIGADFSHTMLVLAKEKSTALGNGSSNLPRRSIPFFEADALRLPFADQSFDLVTTAFGFRNLANYEAGL